MADYSHPVQVEHLRKTYQYEGPHQSADAYDIYLKNLNNDNAPVNKTMAQTHPSIVVPQPGPPIDVIVGPKVGSLSASDMPPKNRTEDNVPVSGETTYPENDKQKSAGFMVDTLNKVFGCNDYCIGVAEEYGPYALVGVALLWWYGFPSLL